MMFLKYWLPSAAMPSTMMLLTGVSQVAINYRTPSQRALDRLTLSQARRHLAEG